MRIALYHNLPSGGAKRTLFEATRRLAARHDVDVFTTSSADHEFCDIRPWVAKHHVAPFEPLRLLASPFGRANQAIRCADLMRLNRVGRKIAAAIDSGHYDVVLTHPCQFQQGPGVLRYLERTPSVYYLHEPPRVAYEAIPFRPYDDTAIARRRLLNRIDPLPVVYRYALRHGDRRSTRCAWSVLVNSHFTAEQVSRVYGLRATVCYHGVDVDYFQPTGEKRDRFVLSVGSLTPLKGFDFLLRSLAACPDRARPRLVIASNFQNPPERNYLQRLAADLGITLELRLAVTDDDLLRLYNQAWAVLYAPVREPFGLVPLESMACATPVIAVAEGGIRESVVDGETGLLSARDEAQFASNILRVIHDPVLAQRLGSNGRHQVLERWTWEHATSALERCLQAASDSAMRDAQVPAPSPLERAMHQ